MALPYIMARQRGGLIVSLALAFVTSQTDTVNRQEYSFSGVDIGGPSADRIVVIGAGTASASNEFVMASIGGPAATLVRTNGVSTMAGGIAARSIASGSTADISYALNSSGGGRSACFVCSMKGYQSAIAAGSDFKSFQGSNQTAIDLTVNLPSESALLAYHSHNNTGATTWTGATAVADVGLSGLTRFSAALFSTEAGESNHLVRAAWPSNASDSTLILAWWV